MSGSAAETARDSQDYGAEVLSFRKLQLVTEELGKIATYSYLPTAEELGITPQQHGEYIVEANAAVHPETD